MSYKYLNDALNEYWADQRCVRCDARLDRRGSFCFACMEKVQAELLDEQAEAKEVRTAMVRKPIHSIETKDDRQYSTLETWAFLNREFEKLFKK